MPSKPALRVTRVESSNRPGHWSQSGQSLDIRRRGVLMGGPVVKVLPGPAADAAQVVGIYAQTVGSQRRAIGVGRARLHGLQTDLLGGFVVIRYGNLDHVFLHV